jgi:CRP-like cAMP-binding protein
VFGEVGAVFRVSRSTTALVRTAAEVRSYQADHFLEMYGAQAFRRLLARWPGAPV